MATGAIVASAVLELGTTHWGIAVVALPLLTAAAIIAWLAYPTVFWRAALAVGLLVLAIALGGVAAGSRRRLVGRAPRRGRGRGTRRLVPRRRRSVPRLADTARIARDYLTLTKPRIMSLLLVTGAGGMFVGAQGVPPLDLFVVTMVGLALACGGASGPEPRPRSGHRRPHGEPNQGAPVASGRVTPAQALEFGLVLSALSFALWLRR